MNVRAIIQNLSLKRLTDQEIVDFLHTEKQIDIGRSTVTLARIKMEKEAGKWYSELRQSTNKYITAYKQRVDSLLSYQKMLHEIIASSKRPEVQIRAISELHSIEMSIFSLWRQLPDLDIVDKVKEQQQQLEHIPPIVDIEDVNGIEHEPDNPWHDYYKCDGCQRWWRNQELRDYHRKKSTNSECTFTITRTISNDARKSAIGNQRIVIRFLPPYPK